MKIRPRNIPKFLTGNKLWYQEILDYDPTKYVSIYDTSRLVNGDMKDTNLTPWKSNISGYDLGRYLPTTGYGAYGENGPHYNYTKGVEGQDYYQQFGKDLLDANGNFTETGLAWAKAVDALLPPGSNASFFDSNNNLRNNWTVGHNDAHNRNRLRNYTKLSDYVNDIRYDQILGARHNVFLRKGKRYFYTDNEGNRHWVDPEEAKNYTISKDPVELGWEGTTYWDDYELTGPESSTDDGSTDVRTRHEKYGFDWSKLKDAASKLLNNPNLYANGRLLGSLVSNEKIYNEALQGIKPALRQTYNTYRLVVGDEASKLAYYRRATAGQTKAALPFTSDADRQTAYMQESRRVGDELRALGDLIDNQEIRRTSDESNLHQWANTLRATEVANANIASIILANALRHNLLAQKHAAQWSSIDNHLKGIETRKWRQIADQQAIDDLIFALTELLKLASNPEILTAQQNLQTILDKHTTNGITDWNDSEVKDAIRKFNEIKNLEVIESLNRRKSYYLNRGTVFAKSGTKITRKSKDDLLYKSARDVVEHFRKISKMASDSYNRKTPKIEKLAPHPKGSTRKYLLGGLAPFTVYTPVVLGGETSTTSTISQTGTSGGDSKKDKNETLDMVKELFKTMQGKGLPSDVNSLYVLMLNFLERAKAFGEDVSTDDIASMYLSLMHQVNNIEYLKSAHDASEKTLIQNGGENEFAVDFRGYLVCLSEEGDIKYAKSIADAAEKKLNPLTNHLLSQMRAIDPKLAARTDLDGVIANGVGILKIAEFLKNLLPNLGSTQTTIPGYTKKGTNDVINGLNLLLEAPEGVYEYTKHSKELNELVKMAISYLKGILPQNMRSIIKARADYSRLTGLPGANEDLLITSLVASGYNSETTYTLEGVTGLAVKNSNNNSSDKISSNPLLAMQREIGGNPITYSIITRDSNTKMSVNGTSYPALPKIKNDMSIDAMLSTSGLDQIVLSKQGITFGDQQINPENLKDIMYANSGRNAIVTLPCKIVNGVKQVNLAVRDEYEKAELRAANLAARGTDEYLRILGKELKEAHLDSLLDSNGLPDKNMFSEFLIVEAYATDKINFNNKNSQYIEKVNNPTEDLENRINLALSTDDKKSNYNIDVKDKLALFELTYNDVYRGTVFIPINNNPAAATLNDDIKINQQQDLEELYLISNKSNKFVRDNSF